MNRSRREVLVLGAAALLGIPDSRAQSPPRKVVWLGWGKASEKFLVRVRTAFAARGLVEGRDFTLTCESFREDSRGAAEAQVDELASRRPDVVVMVADWRIELLQKRSPQLPIVFYNMGGDPVGFGVVETLRRPGKNATGTTWMSPQFEQKMWQLLKELKPSLKRGGRLYSGSNRNMTDDRGVSVGSELDREVESQLGIAVRNVPISEDASSHDGIVAAVAKSRAEALVIWMDVSEAVGESLKASRILSCGHGLASLKKGLLLALGWDWLEGEAQAVAMAASILRGASPATIPVYRHERRFVGVNLRTARAMGLTVPASIRLQATEVIE